MASLLQRLNRQQNAYTKAKENIASHCEGVHGGQHGSGTEKGGKRRRLAPAPLGSTQVRATLSDHCEEKYPRHAKCAQQTVHDTRPPPPQANRACRVPGQDLDSGSGDPPLLARLRDARQRWAEAKRAAEVAGVRAKGLSGQAVCDPSEPPGEVEEEKEDCAAQILFEAVARARAEEPVDAEEGQEGGAREDMVAWLIRRVESSRAHTGRAEKEAEVSQEEEQPRQCGSGMRNMKDHPAEQEGSARVASALQRLKMRVRLHLCLVLDMYTIFPFSSRLVSGPTLRLP